MALAVYLVCGLVISLLMTGFLIRYFLVVVTVENVSMSPTLEPGDRILMIRRWPAKWLRKGQIVLVYPWRTSSTDPGLFEVIPYIKRIIGLGGETITLTINQHVEIDHIHRHGLDKQQHQVLWPIPERHIFVRGDNSTGSIDSLTWGPLPFQSVLAVMLKKLPRN
jgi:signal peptidase I